MASTETGDGHQRLDINQVSSIQVPGAVTLEGHEEAVMDPDASVGVRDPALVPGSSPRFSELWEADTFVAAEKEKQSKELKHKETAPRLVTCLITPLNPPPSKSSSSSAETDNRMSVHRGEPGSTSETNKESSDVKMEDGCELKEDNSLEKSHPGPKETNMDMTPDVREEIKHTVEKEDQDTHTVEKEDQDTHTVEKEDQDTHTVEKEDQDTHTVEKEDQDTHTVEKEDQDTHTKKKMGTQEYQSLGCKVRFSTADDLDEMMDIGTVDQLEQEAQMNEEGQNDSMDVDSSSSPAVLNTVLVVEDNNSEVDTDVKPTVLTPAEKDDQVEDVKVPLNTTPFSSSPLSEATASTVSVVEENNSEVDTDVKPTVPPPAAEDHQFEDVKVPLDMMQYSSSPSSQATASTGSDCSSPAVNGMKVVKLSIPRSDSERMQESARSSPSPPLVKVKDEPIDEEYDQALTSFTSTASVKDEPNTAKEDLRIGSVYSVTPAAETQTPPAVQPASLHMTCSHCKKSLMKGQTAFQRKGSPALFCSTACLTTSISTGKGVKVCFNCQKVIFRPQDVILVPDSKGAMKEFCSGSCLTTFNAKKISTNYRTVAPTEKSSQPVASQPQSTCSMCMRHCVSKHEVILSGSVHKICSDSCFNRFRKVNNLSMAGCANCGSYCHSKSLLLKMEDNSKTLCNTECLAKYKQKTHMIVPCAMCRTTRSVAEMIDNKNNDDSVNLFCSSSCVMAFMVQSVSSSGARLSCDSCGKHSVPAYHLAMSDTSIRNFCTLPCVMSFQEKFKASQKQVNVFTKLPVGSTQAQVLSPQPPQQDGLKAPATLSCSQCTRKITFKPELVQIKEKVVFVCGVDCSQEFKKANCVTSLCEYCKMERITKDSKKINFKDCSFCSDGCKLLFRHELAKSWGKHCHSCSYCHCVSKKLVTAQYGGSTEEFCSDECRSKYTMLFCHVAKCDTCGQKGKLKQSLPMLGEVKHFCDLKCLLQFCSDKVTQQGDVLQATREATPIIANVISLAGAATGKHSGPDGTAQQSTMTINDFHSKTSGRISIQSEILKAPPPPPAAPSPKVMKNKALLCRPLVQNKGVSCRTQTSDAEVQTDDRLPRVLVLPVPVPVYVPVPMSMYSQCTPKAVGLPLPLPVPMFLPVTMNNAERIVETIKEIKEKIPADPFEAELILMAEMVAEQSGTIDKAEAPKEKVTDRAKDKREEAAPEDHTSNYSDELDTDDLASFLNTWDDPGPRSPPLQKLNPLLDIPVGMPSEPYSEPPPPVPPPMDVEADFTVETLEKMAQLREQPQKPASPPPPAPRRRQAHRKARDKKGRKSNRSTKVLESSPSQRVSANKNITADVPKLRSQYGVDSWKRWIQWRQTQPDLEKPRFGSRPMELKEDILRCTTAELSYGLCCFIAEVKRPSGELYTPDSLFYLCLGIQQYLFENGRVENIFMDRFYNKFSTEFTNMLRCFQPTVTASGYIHSRVEEEFLWGCKQLGAYSPIVLLNTLLFFCCKYFGFSTVEQHRQLSFAHVMRCTKTNQNNTKTTFLRFYPPISINEAEPDPDCVPAKRRKEEEGKEEILEMMENTENPLRCPVRLYEFYLSKCSESVKQRTNLFYLHPERCCVPNSPLWFSSSPLDDSTMEAMLTRILTVRELHLKTSRQGGTEPPTPDDPPFIPEEGNDDSE